MVSPESEPGPQNSENLRAGQRVRGACALCGQVLLKILPYRYAFHGRYLYGVTCASCSLTFLHPMPSDSEIEGMYSEEYFTECSETCGAHGNKPYFELAELTADRRRAGARDLDRRFRRHLPQGGTLCEIGCGPGFLLAEMRELGWNVRGVEISRYAAEYARRELKLDVAVGPIAPEILAGAELDAVFMGDVLEHLPRPIESLSAVRTWLRPGGILAVAVPSTMNLLSAQLGMSLYRLLSRVKTLRIPPYHLHEYTPRTVRRTIAQAGFEILELRQGAVPIGRMGLRGNAIENIGKVSLQLLALTTSKICNAGGDRLLVLARKIQT